VFAGFIIGDISDVSGVTENVNLVLGPLSITTFGNAETGDFIGMTLGVGPSATAFGASASQSITGVAAYEFQRRQVKSEFIHSSNNSQSPSQKTNLK
jgi:hypothetical protein